MRKKIPFLLYKTRCTELHREFQVSSLSNQKRMNPTLVLDSYPTDLSSCLLICNTAKFVVTAATEHAIILMVYRVSWDGVLFPHNSPYSAVLCTCSQNSTDITPVF